MSGYCKDVCRFFGTDKIGDTIIGIGMYDMGYKYCSVCAYWFSTRELNCKCCKLKLRTLPCQRKREVKRY